MSLNPFFMLLSGNLTRDPDLRFTPSGSAVANFNIAVNRNYQNKKTMEWVENTDFYRIITWYKLAENCAESLKKGDRVVVVGRKLSASTYEKDGEHRITMELTASIVAPSLEFASCEIKKNARGDYSEDYQEARAESGDDDIDFASEDIPF